MQACELLAVELRLDRVEAELARELPPHMRAFAQAYARGAASPRAPEVLLRPATLATARAALVHPLLADRGLALLRLAAPIAIEADAAVAAARAAPVGWAALAALAAARNAASLSRLGRGALDVLHRLHGLRGLDGVTGDAATGLLPALPAPVAGWSEPDGVEIDDQTVIRMWDALRAQHGVAGMVRFEASGAARPRTFVVVPGREVVVVIPALRAAPSARFAILHELGHAIAALALPGGIPRVVDEAAAAYVARLIEREAVLGGAWYSPAAATARARRGLLARVLDRTERAVAAPSETIAERPPWALWHDPGAQAAYVAAEVLADALDHALGAAPPPGALASALASHGAAIDRDTAF